MAYTPNLSMRVVIFMKILHMGLIRSMSVRVGSYGSAVDKHVLTIRGVWIRDCDHVRMLGRVLPIRSGNHEQVKPVCTNVAIYLDAKKSGAKC